jgi:hypothetical protein
MGESSYFLTTGFDDSTQRVLAAQSGRGLAGNQWLLGMAREKFLLQCEKDICMLKFQTPCVTLAAGLDIKPHPHPSIPRRQP